MNHALVQSDPGYNISIKRLNHSIRTLLNKLFRKKQECFKLTIQVESLTAELSARDALVERIQTRCYLSKLHTSQVVHHMRDLNRRLKLCDCKDCYFAGRWDVRGDRDSCDFVVFWETQLRRNDVTFERSRGLNYVDKDTIGLTVNRGSMLVDIGNSPWSAVAYGRDMNFEDGVTELWGAMQNLLSQNEEYFSEIENGTEQDDEDEDVI